MKLTNWNPVGELETMRHRLDRLFHQMVPTAGVYLPSVDIYRQAKDLVVAVDLPGLSPEHITVEVTDDAIHLLGESRREEEEIRAEDCYRAERQYGRFERSIPLPQRINDEEAHATFRNGVLKIRAPLAEEPHRAKARKIGVERD
jgi:HSP20 family protein